MLKGPSSRMFRFFRVVRYHRLFREVSFNGKYDFLVNALHQNLLANQSLVNLLNSTILN